MLNKWTANRGRVGVSTRRLAQENQNRRAEREKGSKRFLSTLNKDSPSAALLDAVNKKSLKCNTIKHFLI